MSFAEAQYVIDELTDIIKTSSGGGIPPKPVSLVIKKDAGGNNFIIQLASMPSDSFLENSPIASVAGIKLLMKTGTDDITGPYDGDILADISRKDFAKYVVDADGKSESFVLAPITESNPNYVIRAFPYTDSNTISYADSNQYKLSSTEEGLGWFGFEIPYTKDAKPVLLGDSLNYIPINNAIGLAEHMFVFDSSIIESTASKTWLEHPWYSKILPYLLAQDGSVQMALNPNDISRNLSGEKVDLSNSGIKGLGVYIWIPKIYTKYEEREAEGVKYRVCKFSTNSSAVADFGYKPLGFVDKDGNELEGVWIPYNIQNITGKSSIETTLDLYPRGTTLGQYAASSKSLNNRFEFYGGALASVLTDISVAMTGKAHAFDAFVGSQWVVDHPGINIEYSKDLDVNMYSEAVKRDNFFIGNRGRMVKVPNYSIRTYSSHPNTNFSNSTRVKFESAHNNNNNNTFGFRDELTDFGNETFSGNTTTSLDSFIKSLSPINLWRQNYNSGTYYWDNMLWPNYNWNSSYTYINSGSSDGRNTGPYVDGTFANFINNIYKGTVNAGEDYINGSIGWSSTIHSTILDREYMNWARKLSLSTKSFRYNQNGSFFGSYLYSSPISILKKTVINPYYSFGLTSVDPYEFAEAGQFMSLKMTNTNYQNYSDVIYGSPSTLIQKVESTKDIPPLTWGEYTWQNDSAKPLSLLTQYWHDSLARMLSISRIILANDYTLPHIVGSSFKSSYINENGVLANLRNFSNVQFIESTYGGLAESGVSALQHIPSFIDVTSGGGPSYNSLSNNYQVTVRDYDVYNAIVSSRFSSGSYNNAMSNTNLTKDMMKNGIAIRLNQDYTSDTRSLNIYSYDRLNWIPNGTRHEGYYAAIQAAVSDQDNINTYVFGRIMETAQVKTFEDGTPYPDLSTINMNLEESNTALFSNSVNLERNVSRYPTSYSSPVPFAFGTSVYGNVLIPSYNAEGSYMPEKSVNNIATYSAASPSESGFGGSSSQIFISGFLNNDETRTDRHYKAGDNLSTGQNSITNGGKVFGGPICHVKRYVAQSFYKPDQYWDFKNRYAPAHNYSNGIRIISKDHDLPKQSDISKFLLDRTDVMIPMVLLPQPGYRP